MVYSPPEYPTDIPTETGVDPDLPDRLDDLDWNYGLDINNSKKELIAALKELGTLPKGTHASVKARLDAQRIALYGSVDVTVIETYTDAAHIKQPIELKVAARVTRHVVIDPKRFKMPGADYPGESFEGLFYTLDFDKNTEECSYAQEHVPFRWDATTDIIVRVDWLHDSVDNGKVVWGIEYKAIGTGEVVTGAGTTITQASAGNHAAGILVRTEFTSKILAANLSPDDLLGLCLGRVAGDGEDTLDEDARMLGLHLHFIQNKLGKAV